MDILSKYIFLFKNRLIRLKSHNAYQAAIKYQYIPVEMRKEMELTARKLLVEHAYNYCAFYREYYDSFNFHPSMLITEMDWEKVPVLEKWMIRQYGEKMISSAANFNKLFPSKTGGSTGKPLVVYKSKHVHFEVLGWRALQWYGIAPWMNEAIVHRRVPITFLQKIKNRAMWWPTRRAYLSATHISAGELAWFVEEIIQKRIKWIVGYCGALEYVADYILVQKIQIHSVKLVWSTSSPLTKIVRDKLERAFHCSVMDQYGCCEMGNIAIQKPHEDYLTVNSDYVHVDIIDGNTDVTNTHKLGDICITDLNTLEFPLIKYRLGDRSRMIKTMMESEDGFPKLAFVQGRISDMIYLPDGSCIDGSYLTTICDNYSEYISCYQIYQTMSGNIIFRVIPKSKNEQSIAAIYNVLNALYSLVERQIQVKLELTDKIDDFAGKRKFIISEIALSRF